MTKRWANPRASLDAAIAFCLYSRGHKRRASEPERYDEFAS
jgi:hypothetical protein